MNERWDHDYIRAVRQKKDKHRDSPDLHGLLQLISESMYGTTIHWALELIQNAEDEAASYVSFTVGDDYVLVENDGEPFNRDDVLSLLRENDVALCLNDLEWMTFSPEATTDCAYFRWLSHPSRNRSTALEPRELTSDFISWVGRVREVAARVEEVYGFFNDRYGGHAPRITNLLKEILGLSPVDPRSLWPQQLRMFGE